MDHYTLQQKIGDGTFSQVFKAKCLKTGRYTAIKCMKKEYASLQEVTTLKQIQALRMLSPHDNIVKLIQVLYDQPTGKLALVFELMQQNLYQCLVKNKTLNLQKIKYYMFQLLKSIAYIHKKSIFHRDIKPQNVLITGDVVKLADFGSCKGIYSHHPYTEYISTRWYRAPQCLLTDGYYDHKMDIWGFGCVFFEMVSREPLFNGKNQLDQIHKIIKILGSPKEDLLNQFKKKATHLNAKDWHFPYSKGVSLHRLLPAAPKDMIDLLQKLLKFDPHERISAQQALQHEYFSQIIEAMNNKFHSTVFGFQNSYGQTKNNIKNQQTPQKIKINKNKQRLKKQNSKGIINQQTNTFPPIHQINIGIKLNVYGSTVKTYDNTFKKTLAHLSKKKQKQQNYLIVGKNMDGQK